MTHNALSSVNTLHSPSLSFCYQPGHCVAMEGRTERTRRRRERRRRNTGNQRGRRTLQTPNGESRTNPNPIQSLLEV